MILFDWIVQTGIYAVLAICVPSVVVCGVGCMVYSFAGAALGWWP